ncbi:branched-chain amino acid ABC transporter permease/ATP-binding protein [Nocardioides sp. Iso805N]|uniref:branched-chain amino acid ABC transporter permease/ATP-binding protein n=1 Tax=Nocardioides sp. Iso805N TaxID=1283287 RepID=UPI0003725D3A|nr:branched-chain amino acid ABC transporter permease/ATP-binding protein [Nocardioides sp. Iso805N]
MTVFLQFAIIGMAAGALYVVLALGLVVIHRGSGIVNFGHGAIGMCGTFVFWKLEKDGTLPYALAAAAGVATAALIGLVVYYGLMRPLQRSSMLSRVIASLAVLIIAQEAVALLYPGPSIVVRSGLPTRGVHFWGVTVGLDRLWILGGALAITAILGFVYRFTRFGMATTAATENGRALASLGWSPSRIAACNWAMGSALAGIAGVFLAPITNLSVTGFTLLVVPALAAAVTGRLTSFPLTLVGGLLIGVIQAEVERYVHAPGWSDAVPFLAMLGVLVARGSSGGSRTQIAQRLPRLGTGRIRLPLIALWAAVALVIIWTTSPQWSDSTTTTLGTGLILLSVVVVTGYSGQLSLAQFAIAGWSAWISAGLAAHAHLPFLPAIILGSLAALPLGVIVGVVCLRAQGVNLAVATLGMAVALYSLVFNNSQRTESGQFSIPEPTIGGVDVGAILYSERYATVVLVAFVLFAVMVANLRRGTSGRRLIAVRSNERAAASLGVAVAQTRVVAFALGSVIAGAGGSLLAFRNPIIVFTAYDPIESIQVVGWSVIGGVGFVAGTIYGGLLELGSLGSKVLDGFGPTVGQYLPLAGGVLLALMLLSAQDGLAFQSLRDLGRLRRLLERRRPAVPASGAAERLAILATSTTPHQVTGEPLRLEGVSVSFGGVKALDEVSLLVRPGEVVGVIGPNGAGKSTLIDAATGFVSPARGRVLLGADDLTGRRPAQRVRRGLTRSFQSLELFDDLSVLDNLLVASDSGRFRLFLTDMIRPTAPRVTAATMAAIHEFGLEPYLDSRPADLPYGVRRLVGIARAVATGAKVIALDEPAAGLGSVEARELGHLLRRLADEWDLGILFVEHNVELVLALCDRICVLNFGQVIAEGTPEEIRTSEAVVHAYLGQADDDDTQMAAHSAPLAKEPT